MTTSLSQDAQRLDKLRELKAQGQDPYTRRFRKHTSTAVILEHFEEGRQVGTAGRVIAVRTHGKSLFADVADSAGKLQIYLKSADVGEEVFSFFERVIDLGDVIGVEGVLFKTRAGEPSLAVSSYTLLAKGLHPLPEKWHGLKDKELRYRRRYVDLMVNADVRKIFEVRGDVVRALRQCLDTQEYLEVETPMMHPIPGGAAGQPFVTHHAALDLDLYLRLAPELYLKRLLVGGFERVYELGKSFRNEGISPRHNPEFTMLEAYEAYADCDRMMGLTQDLIVAAAEAASGQPSFSYGGQEIDLTGTWPRISFADLLTELWGIQPDDPLDTWPEKIARGGIDVVLPETPGPLSRTWLINLVGEVLEPRTGSNPVFVVDYPVEISPLAKRRADDPRLAERFELYIGGMELANGYTELNDPLDQRERFEAQLEGLDADQQVARTLDEDFLLALEYGMPPAGGLGIGVDRLLMLLTDQSNIREVVLFPLLKPDVVQAPVS